MVQEYSKHRNIPYIVQNIPYIVQNTTQISLYGEPCTVQYSKSCNDVRDNDFVYAAFVNVIPHNGVHIDPDANNNNDTTADADDTVNSVITTTDNVRDIDPYSVNNNCNCDYDDNKDYLIYDFDTKYGCKCVRDDHFSTHYDRTSDQDDDKDDFDTNYSRNCGRDDDFDTHFVRYDDFETHYEQNMIPINDDGTHIDRNDDEVPPINELSTHYVRKYD